MATIPLTLKDFTIFIDGINFSGRGKDFTPPKFSFTKEDYRAGGMDIPVAIEKGMEMLEVSFKICEFTPDMIAGMGRLEDDTTQIVIRGSQERGATVQSVVYSMRGGFYEMDPGSMEAGKTEIGFKGALTYCRYEVDGRELIEIDAINSVRRIGGVDQLEARRVALGL